MDYALWSTRALGYLIDSLVVGGVLVVLFLVAALGFGAFAGLGAASLGHRDLAGLGGLGCCLWFALFLFASLAVGLYNKVYLVSTRGASIGQGVMKIKVVDAQGRLISQGNALIRLLAHLGLGFLPLGGIIDLLWPLWDERRQTLHDKAVGCYVINCG
jgi:uncharacterized RDD family membrane protein YckC